MGTKFQYPIMTFSQAAQRIKNVMAVIENEEQYWVAYRYCRMLINLYYPDAYDLIKLVNVHHGAWSAGDFTFMKRKEQL